MESLMEAHKGAQTMASAAKKEETTGSLFKSSMFDSVTPFEVLMVEEFSDLNLVIGSHIIGVHQLVLASHSKLIAGILGNATDDGSENVTSSVHILNKACLVLADFSLEAVTAMVHFLYCGELISDRATLPELQIIAYQLGLDALKRHAGELEDRLIREKNECLDGQQQAMSEECFIALTGLEEGFGDEKLIAAQDSQEEEQMLEDGDLHTPLQSPQPPPNLIHQDKDILDTLDPSAIADGNYLQCDLCHISCTDSEYLKRHRRMAHHVDIFKSLEGLVFNCVQCSFSSSNKQSLADHVRVEHSSKEFECSVCNKNFNCLSKLEEHSSSHSEERAFPCLTCNKSFSRSYHLKVHTRIHTGERPYKCSQCEKTFIDSSALRGHMKSHNGEKPFECPTCSRRFKDKGNLKQHEATHKGEKPHQCPQCGQGFVFRRNMVRHMESHEGDLKPDLPSLPQASGEITGVPMILSSLSSASNSVVTDEKKPDECHSCPECQVKFANLKTLRQHRKSVHSTLGSFQCSLCKKSWRNECDLRTHMVEHTDKRKRYLCTHCNKSCDRPSDLEKHIRVHTGDKPFQCQICDKKFADRSLFLKHTRTHKVNDETQVFVCGICDKKFQVEGNLEKHLKVHTTASYACSSCGKKFYDELSLQAHINLHNGATPFNCTFCGKEFNHSADLKKHERVHTGEKPHKCNHCEKSFSDPSALRKHERRHEIVTAPQRIQCLGCSKSFLKEEAFFKHATLLSSGNQRVKRCPGKPNAIFQQEFHPQSVVRCLQCKVTLCNTEELRSHVENPACNGPIYAKVTKEATEKEDIKIINIEEGQMEGMETLTTIVEIGENEKEEIKENEVAVVEKESSVMMVLSQLSKLMGEIEEPKQDKENVEVEV